MMRFASPFDARIHADGPPALFTLDVEGRMRLDAERTREAWQNAGVPPTLEPGHWVLVDRVTGVRMVVLAGHPSLVHWGERADALSFPDHDSAATFVADQWAAGRTPKERGHVVDS